MSGQVEHADSPLGSEMSPSKYLLFPLYKDIALLNVIIHSRRVVSHCLWMKKG